MLSLQCMKINGIYRFPKSIYVMSCHSICGFIIVLSRKSFLKCLDYCTHANQSLIFWHGVFLFGNCDISFINYFLIPHSRLRNKEGNTKYWNHTLRYTWKRIFVCIIHMLYVHFMVWRSHTKCVLKVIWICAYNKCIESIHIGLTLTMHMY